MAGSERCLLMKCKHCGAEIIRIKAMGGTVICWASLTAYWTVRDEHARGLYTPNGISISGNLTWDPQKAVGIGYLPHTCNQKPIILKGRDSRCRPVYEDLSGRLLVDVDPREDREPDICTKQENTFNGEPCDPVEGDFDFIPYYKLSKRYFYIAVWQNCVRLCSQYFKTLLKCISMITVGTIFAGIIYTANDRFLSADYPATTIYYQMISRVRRAVMRNNKIVDLRSCIHKGVGQ